MPADIRYSDAGCGSNAGLRVKYADVHAPGAADLSFPLTRAALDRPKQTIHAAEIFHENARTIASVCREAARDEVIVATVDREDMAFAGVWTFPVGEISRRLPPLEGRGWALIFSPGTSVEEIQDRSLRMARLAFRRWEAMMKWSSSDAT